MVGNRWEAYTVRCVGSYVYKYTHPVCACIYIYIMYTRRLLPTFACVRCTRRFDSEA